MRLLQEYQNLEGKNILKSLPKKESRGVPLHRCFISCLQLCVIGGIDDGKEKEKEELPDHHIYNWWDLDRAAFGDVKQVAAEQAHDVALVPVTPWSKIQARCNVREAILLHISRLRCFDDTAKLTEEGFLEMKIETNCES